MNPSFSRWSSREIVFADAMMRASEFLVGRNGDLTLDPAPLSRSAAFRRASARAGPTSRSSVPARCVGAWLFGGLEGTLPDGRVPALCPDLGGHGHLQPRGHGGPRRGRRDTAPRRGARRSPSPATATAPWRCGSRARTAPIPCATCTCGCRGRRDAAALLAALRRPRARAERRRRAARLAHARLDARVNDYGAHDPPLPFVFDRASAIAAARAPSQGTRRGCARSSRSPSATLVGRRTCTSRCRTARTRWTTRRVRALPARRFTRSATGRRRCPASTAVSPSRARPGARAARSSSNEMWNAFPVNRWLQLEATRRGVTLARGDRGRARSDVWRIADEVFAGRARYVRRFIGGFVAESDCLRRILEALPRGTRRRASDRRATSARGPDIVAALAARRERRRLPELPDARGSDRGRAARSTSCARASPSTALVAES